jgi:MinD superfamily P-loop ATPase
MGFYEFKTKTMIPTPFVPAFDKDQCNACGSCIDICPMKALKMDDIPVLDADTCIGCGLCVTHCSPAAIKLVRRKTEVEIPEEVKSHIG